MSEHQFKGIYNLGYGDALYEHRKRTWPMTLGLVIIAAVVTFWAGRMSMQTKVTEAYDDGFEAGVREGTTRWGEWR